MSRRLLLAVLAAAALAAGFVSLDARQPVSTPGPLRFEISYPASRSETPLDGRLLLILSTRKDSEPRFHVTFGEGAQPIFGLDLEGWPGGAPASVGGTTIGFPVERLSELPAGTYTVQALFHRYETFKRSDGHTVKMPMDRGEGQQWNLAPGNLYSTPRQMTLDPVASGAVSITLDQIIPDIPAVKDTKYVKHERIQSALLTKFWGRPMHIGAAVLLPEGWDTHPQAKYPLFVYHGHFPATISGWRETPPDPNLAPDYSARFSLKGYNRIQQEYGYQLYKEWTGPNFPRGIAIEIQHANPFYDDSYAVNSANLGPYGDAIVQELIPYLEKKYRGIGAGWARFMYGGSTGGWEAMAAQVFYPELFNGAYIACPDPIDFRAFTTVNIYKDRNAYFLDEPFKRTPRPAHRNWLGHVDAMQWEVNRLELVLGTRTRSGQQYDIWEAVFSPVGRDGYPARIWDKGSGVIDKDVANYWRENYDLVHILKRDWEAKGLGKKLEGKLHIYVGDMDNYYLNNAVYLAEEFLESTRNPYYNGEVDYGDRAEHCWNGDQTRANAYSRLRYHQMFIPRAVERMLKTAPPGADLKSWRY
jgi:hypothetical protein